MPKYVVLYRFTENGAKDIRGTVTRARQTREQNEKRGFKVQALLWTQGPYDLVAVRGRDDGRHGQHRLRWQRHQHHHARLR
jgi:uncharacterized protein with GYD domain